MKVKTNDKVFRTVVRPALVYRSETWAWKMVQEHQLDVAEMRMVRRNLRLRYVGLSHQHSI